MARFYRVIWGPVSLPEYFLSSKDKGLQPPLDPELLRLHDGLSVFNTEQQARNKAIALELGDHIAVLEIPEDGSIRCERTLLGSRGHHTVWGDPTDLVRLVVSIVPV